MPMTPGCQPSGATTRTGARAQRRIALDQRDRFIERRLLDHAPLLVELVEFARDRLRLVAIVRRKQPRAEIAAPDPPARR